MEKVMKAITPPILWAALRAVKRPRLYPNWEAVSAAAATYDDQALNAFRKARADMGHESDVTRTPLPMLLDGIKGPACVVDYGGAFGDIGRAIVRLYPQTHCTVVETAGVVSMANAGGQVTFCSEMPDACDVFFSSGTLQYLAEPYDVARRAFGVAKHSVAFWRNNFADQETFMVHKSRLYENGTGPVPNGYADCAISYPCRTLQEARLCDVADRAGFRLAFRALDSSGHMSTTAYGANLVFMRRR